MGTQLYLQRDVRRMMLALGAFVVVPCVLLVFLAWQSVRMLHEAALAQQRDVDRRDLRDIGLMACQRLEDLLQRTSEPLRAQAPSGSAFWTEAMRRLDRETGIRTVLVLDSAGRLAFPRPGPVRSDDLPRLSPMHPAYGPLQDARRAHWTDGNPARALEQYRLVVEEPRTPLPVRVGVWAEMAQCELQRGDVPAALGCYDHMAEAAQELAPPVLPLLRALELAQQANDGERARRWAYAILDTCTRRGMEMELNELETVAARLRVWETPWPDDLAGLMDKMARLAEARAALDSFVRAHGTGPFPFHAGSGGPDFEPVMLPSSAPETARLLVDARAAWPDGSRLAFEVDLPALRNAVLEPALRELVARRGGRAEWMAASPPGSTSGTDPDARMIHPLPAPLDSGSIHYRPAAASMWTTLAASRSKTRALILGIALALALLGLAVPFAYMRRSLRLAGLQSDVMDRISHELKTPIAALSVLAGTLERRGADVDPAADRQVRALLHDEVQRLVRLSDRLLDFARQRAGMAPLLDREPVRLDALLAEIALQLPAETGLPAGRLACDIRRGDYAGEFDRVAVGVIARNLVENAVKYCDGPAVVHMSLHRDGDTAVLAVADNGWGMDARTLRRLFTPYFRADNSLAARVPGLGLGLAIVQGLVRAHGGAITVRSTPGRGSTFEIRLPLISGSGGPP